MKKIILIFGNGYVSKFLFKELINEGWLVYCTSRKFESEAISDRENIKIINFSDPGLPTLLESVNAILSTVPTDGETVDPVLERYCEKISQGKFEWVGYLSATSVYGDHQGKWVDEKARCLPSSDKSKARLLAENKWLDLYSKFKIPVHIFRLSGIYGPGRNCLEEINNGKDSTIVKKDHYFSRIHVFDICQAIMASLNSPTPGEIYNVSDDDPASLSAVQQFGAKILSKHPLKEIFIENAHLSKQLEMFFNDNKKVSSTKIADKLKIKWKYPDYRIGLLQGCLPYLD